MTVSPQKLICGKKKRTARIMRREADQGMMVARKSPTFYVGPLIP